MLTREELLDLMALYEVDPWGESRADMRAAVNTCATVMGFAELQYDYPYVPTDSDDFSDEDEAELIAILKEMNQGKDGATRTAESETDRVS